MAGVKLTEKEAIEALSTSDYLVVTVEGTVDGEAAQVVRRVPVSALKTLLDALTVPRLAYQDGIIGMIYDNGEDE